jgi:bifunctional DNase/RNase
LAQEEARALGHDYLGTEHLLLSLIREGEGLAAAALESLGISLEAVRQQVEEIIGAGQQTPSGHTPFTPRAKKVLELSLREALQLGHDQIGIEHLLLGLIREGQGVAAQVLVKLGADLNRVRQQVIQLLHGDQGTEPAGAPAAPPEPGKLLMAARASAIGSRLSEVWQRAGARPGTGGLGQLPPGTVQMTLMGVRVEIPSDQPIVLLKEVSGDRYLPIWIGPVEATAIAFAHQGMKPAAPLTHDLFWDVLKTMGIRLLNVTISTRVDDVFYGHLSLSNHRTVSARPSDAIALAIRAGAPILVGVELLDEAGVTIPDDVP